MTDGIDELWQQFFATHPEWSGETHGSVSTACWSAFEDWVRAEYARLLAEQATGQRMRDRAQQPGETKIEWKLRTGGKP